jgi:hypothetical protein
VGFPACHVISSLDYFESLTFKRLPHVPLMEETRWYDSDAQSRLISSGILTATLSKENEITILNGMATSREQVRIIRIGDYSILGIGMQ